MAALDATTAGMFSSVNTSVVITFRNQKEAVPARDSTLSTEFAAVKTAIVPTARQGGLRS